MTIPVYALTVSHLNLLKHHFDKLDVAAVHLRFGNNLSREARRAYVDRIPFARDALFGVFADDLTLLGVAHLACLSGAAELGISVLASHQNKGVGSALFDRAAMHASNLQIVELFMNCLAQNSAMMHIARKAGMRIVVENADADAYLELPPGTPFSVGQEFVEQELARLDWTLKTNVDYLRQASKAARALTSQFRRQGSPNDPVK